MAVLVLRKLELALMELYQALILILLVVLQHPTLSIVLTTATEDSVFLLSNIGDKQELQPVLVVPGVLARL